jgi:hypothetical protein
MTKTLTLNRVYAHNVTIGELLDGNKFICFTLEEPWKDNQKSISCIPEGEYICKPHVGTKYKDVWNISNVKDRSAVLIHSGNTTLDIEGCVLVGSSRGIVKGLPAVLNSRATLDELKQYIGRDKTGKLNEFKLIIKKA